MYYVIDFSFTFFIKFFISYVRFGVEVSLISSQVVSELLKRSLALTSGIKVTIVVL
jgi:hypothetical protein